MPEFSLPPLYVDHDDNWIVVDLNGDLGTWARRTARDIGRRMPWRGRRRAERRMASVLERAGAIARAPDDASIALLLAPDVYDKIKAIVRFCPVRLDGQDEDGAFTALLDEFPSEGVPEITEMTTPAGRCRRLRSRFAASEQSAGPPRGQHVS